MVVAVQVRPSFAIVTLMASYLALGLAEAIAGLLRSTGDEATDDALEDEDEAIAAELDEPLPLLDEEEELLD